MPLTKNLLALTNAAPEGELVRQVQTVCQIIQMPKILEQRQQVGRNYRRDVKAPVHINEKQGEQLLMAVLITATHKRLIHLGRSNRKF